MTTYVPQVSRNHVPGLTLSGDASTSGAGGLGTGKVPLTTITNIRDPRKRATRPPYNASSSITTVPSTSVPTCSTPSDSCGPNHPLQPMPDLSKAIEDAYQILKRHNLVSNRSPASTKNQQGVAAEESAMSVTYRNATAVRRSLAFPSVRAIRSQNIRSLSLSLNVPRRASITEEMVLQNLAEILRSLPALKELTITGKDTPLTVTRDIFRGSCFSLEKLHCESEKLLVASWDSIGRRSIRDFRGFGNVVDAPPPEVRPWDMASLEHLETSAHFAERLTLPANITHISLHTNRSMTKPTLCYLSNLLGDQLVSLRVTRTFVASKTPPAEAVERDQIDLFWHSDSPLMICCMLRAPKLAYLEIRDISLLKWSVNAHSVRNVPWIRKMVGTPALQRLVWRPAWAERVRELHTITTEHIRDCFSLLPSVDFVAIPTEAVDVGMWRVSLRGPSPEEFETHWPPCAIREDSWRI